MDNKTIAELLANLCYKPKQSYSGEFAAQIFVENIVLPEYLDNYTEKELERYILEFLEK